MKDLAGRVEDTILSQAGDSAKVEETQKRLSLTHNRFDLAFKLYFLPLLESASYSDYRRACYKNHIKAFSFGSFAEPGNLEKNSYEKYEDVFRRLLHDIKRSGFDGAKSLIPLAEDGSILNGAHRTSIAIYLNKAVSVFQTKLPPVNYDYKHFKKRGVPTDMLDCVAQTFIEHDKNCFLAFVWPAAQGFDDDIETIFSRIAYKKNVSLNYNGAHNLLSQVYQDEHWLGAKDQNYPGVRNKLVGCFPNFNDVRVYLFQADGLSEVLALKDQVRDLFNLEKHAIHITDTPEETMRIGRLVFNENSLHFLNNANPNRFCDSEDKANAFLEALASKGLSVNNYVLDSGLVMAIYGLRKANDIDYLTTSISFETDEIEHHADELPYHGVSEIELVDNPKYYFWYEDLKYISLNQLYIMKNNRSEEKDRLDNALIKSLISNAPFKVTCNKIKFAYYLRKEWLWLKTKLSLIEILKIIGVYDQARMLYRKKYKKGG
ncbi:hypothetical protein ACFL3A_05260 [Pseudomonadota bacterium]